MPFRHTPAGEVSDFDPERTSQEDVILICLLAEYRMSWVAECCAARPDLAAAAQRIQNDIWHVACEARKPEVRLCWRSLGHAERILRALSRLEQEARRPVFEGADRLSPEHPLQQIAAREREYQTLKREGKIFGIIQF